jgi:GTP-binding protein Era
LKVLIMADEFRSGFVAVVGRPNAGKSTLVNALVGEKVSIVTSKPQTTRHRILGIRNRPGSQIIFVDTPGLHAHARKLINRTMNRAAVTSVEGADLVLMVVEGEGWRGGDDHVLERLSGREIPIVLVVNKIDRVRPRTELIPFLEKCGHRGAFAAIIPVSALTGENLDQLLEIVQSHLPAGPMLFPADMTTDRSMAFRVAEVLREKLMESLQREVPYGLAVEIEALEETAGLLRVSAVIWVSKDSQRPIVVGRGGATLKKVGQAARIELDKLFDKRVYLQTHVRVRRNWADDARALRQFGHELDS